MKLLRTLLSWDRPVRPVGVAAVDDQATAAQAPPPGCGWFDSSRDLRAGLQVREHAANDAACAELQLAMWLEQQLA